MFSIKKSTKCRIINRNTPSHLPFSLPTKLNPYNTSSSVPLFAFCRPIYNVLQPIVYIIKTENMSGVSDHPEYEAHDDDDPDSSHLERLLPSFKCVTTYFYGLSMEAKIEISMLDAHQTSGITQWLKWKYLPRFARPTGTDCIGQADAYLVELPRRRLAWPMCWIPINLHYPPSYPHFGSHKFPH